MCVKFLDQIAPLVGMERFSEVTPELHQQIVILQPLALDKVKSFAELAIVSGYYTEWLEHWQDQLTLAAKGCTVHRRSLSESEALELDAMPRRPVVLVNPKLEFICREPGIVELEDLASSGYWAPFDQMVDGTDLTVAQYLGVEAAKVRNTLLFRGKTYNFK